MKAPAGLFVELFACSACFWALFTLFKFISVSRFIVKRYEKETKLLDTVFFKNHFAFTRYLPNLHSTCLYAFHLVMCTWGWRFRGKNKPLRDISDPEQVTRHFTSKEIRRAQLLLVYLLITGLHAIAFFIWTENFFKK
jgi:hypothetical protein